MRIRDSALRAVVIVLTASLSLVLLPIAINVGTGGTAPSFLAPYVGWTWPAIGVLWLVLILTALGEVRSRQRPVLASRSADKPRNRANALAQVDRTLQRRVDGSLAAQTRVALALDQRPEVVARPYDIVVRPLDRDPHALPDDAHIATVFDDLEFSMLILGAPGAGKTTLLLDLARTLAEQAHADETEPIPVLLNLSRWTGAVSRRPDDHPRDSPQLAGFVRWLLDELDTRYGIHPAAGRRWLINGRFALLLDGLDEVDTAHRDKLAGVLDELRMNYSIPRLAVTCRTEDYKHLKNPLRMQGAVDIKPLSRQQVLDYFTAAGPELDGARVAIEQDDELWDLVTSPLMLNILLLAYQHRDPESVTDLSDVRRALFDTFIVEVLARRRAGSRQYDARTAVRSLRALALRTRNRPGAQSVVPRWPNANGRDADGSVIYLLHTICLPALLAGVIAGCTAVAALPLAICAVLLAYRWRPAGNALVRRDFDRSQLAIAVLAFIAGTAASGVLLLAPSPSFVAGVLTGLFVAGAVRTLTFIPNFWQLLSHPSARWRIGPWALGGALIGFVALRPTDLALLPGILLGMVAVGASPRLSQDAGPLYRVVLDVLLCWTGHLPWRRRAFLTYAADRFILARTAPGEYSFIHLLIRDHLADCDPDQLAAQVDRRVVGVRTDC
ncbi:NACHT domain-containing protein [Kribbella sp. NPDC005582]|uniref:NACHT domain-containing protein n=1 Tax=Kribbella sp. NPDC005582 TaxID=3156893 RepID=UPI00339EEFE6